MEGVETEAYLNPLGIPTLCIGLTEYPNGDNVRMGDVCSEEICRGYTQHILEHTFIPVLSQIPGWHEFGSRRQSALLSFAWNMGVDFYGKSGFEDITNVLKQGAIRPHEYEVMPQVLTQYITSKGRILEGLVHRRKLEAAEWNKESIGQVIFESLQDTYLKKAPINSLCLSDQGKKSVDSEEEITITKFVSLPSSAHARINLLGEDEEWIIYLPHWINLQRVKHKSEEEINWFDMSSQIGKYITVGEILQFNPENAPEPNSQVARHLTFLAEEFDVIREAWGAPIGVVGGYRAPKDTTSSYKPSEKAHERGMALDIYPTGDDVDCLYRWLKPRWSGQIFHNQDQGFVHIDMSNNGRFKGLR